MRRPHAAPYRADDLSGLRVGKANRCHNALDLVRAKYFEAALSGKVSNVFVLKGGMGKKQRRTIAEAMAAVPESEPRVILATGSYIGEGFDDARLDTLFLAMPISWRGTLQQYVGRLHRLHDDKRVVEVYDYVDANVRMLARMYDRRLKGYGDMGYKVLTTSQRRLNI